MLSGTADGSWRGALSFESTSSFVAVALDEHGAELWRWQVNATGWFRKKTPKGFNHTVHPKFSTKFDKWVSLGDRDK